MRFTLLQFMLEALYFRVGLPWAGKFKSLSIQAADCCLDGPRHRLDALLQASLTSFSTPWQVRRSHASLERFYFERATFDRLAWRASLNAQRPPCQPWLAAA